MKVTDEIYQGYECLLLSNEALSVWITKSVGLRVIGLALKGGENLLVVLPEARIEVPGREAYQLHGGHRLWVAPEEPRTTYLPDDQPVETSFQGGGIEQVQPVEVSTGIQKSWGIKLDQAKAEVTISHRLSNLGDQPIRLAPWAISMLRPGGVGILPQRTTPADEHGLLPNRHLVLWPYTPVASPYLHWRDQAVYIEALMKKDALKIGIPNPEGWLAYAVDGELLVKRVAFDRDREYLDRGASSEVYCCPNYIEFETLGPVVDLEPGATVEHEEAWEIFPEGDWPGEILEMYQQFKPA